MTDLEKMLFIRARILVGKTKERSMQEYRKQTRLDKLTKFTFPREATDISC